MKDCISFSLITYLLCSSQSIAQNATEFDPELENQSAMYAECAAYYRLVYFALVESQQEETASAYREMEDNAMFVSLAVASKGRSQDMAVEVTNSRIEMSMKIMKQEIDNRNENISILINKYQFSCQEALSSPSSAVMQVLNSLAALDGLDNAEWWFSGGRRIHRETCLYSVTSGYLVKT